MDQSQNSMNNQVDCKKLDCKELDCKELDCKELDCKELDLKKILKEKFNIPEFRTHQEQIVTDILAHRDLLVLMPTGGGKSLCYQLSSLISPGFSLVISPLIALIWDQIEDLKEKGVDARAWSSDLSAEEIFDLKEGIKSGKVKILYTTPEMLMQSSNLNNLLNLTSCLTKERLLDRIIVDEAHCVSNWGHEFRESYLELVKLKPRLPGIQIVAFTATATPAVQLDIIRILNLSKVKIYRQSYIRENLHYFVKKRETSSKLKLNETFVDEICQWIRENDYTRKTGIIYCLSRDNCEELAENLQNRGFSAEFFHASMPTSDKRLTQMRWLSGETKIIVATIAFALGINKANVRFVIHAALPKSIEGYYQETGRAGRDGKLSRCLLFYNRQDKHILQSMARKSELNMTTLDKWVKKSPKVSVASRGSSLSSIETTSAMSVSSMSSMSSMSSPSSTSSMSGISGMSSSTSTGLTSLELATRWCVAPAATSPIDSIVRTEDMYQWANSNLDCRIESLSRYLGENVTYSCGNCDNCRLSLSTNRRIQPIRRSIKDFLLYAINSIMIGEKDFIKKEELLEDIASNLSHYAGYDRFRVLAQLEALGFLAVKYQLDKENYIHANVILGPRSKIQSIKDIADNDLMMNFTNGTLDNYVYVSPR
jgi:RecQ family ATP-dependent DNA helicase